MRRGARRRRARGGRARAVARAARARRGARSAEAEERGGRRARRAAGVRAEGPRAHGALEREFEEAAKRDGRRARTEVLDLGLELAALGFRDLVCVAEGADDAVLGHRPAPALAPARPRPRPAPPARGGRALRGRAPVARAERDRGPGARGARLPPGRRWWARRPKRRPRDLEHRRGARRRRTTRPRPAPAVARAPPRRAASRNTRSSAKRMPKVCTERQRGRSSARLAGGSSRSSARPSSRARKERATSALPPDTGTVPSPRNRHRTYARTRAPGGRLRPPALAASLDRRAARPAPAAVAQLGRDTSLVKTGVIGSSPIGRACSASNALRRRGVAAAPAVVARPARPGARGRGSPPRP